MTAPTLSLFDYYTAFLSVVLGLAVADMANSLHRLLVARRRVKFRVIPIMGVMAVFGLILAHFLRLWNYGMPMQTVSYYQVAVGTLYCLILFLLAASSLPDAVPDDGLDLQDWYDGNRGYLFGLACLLQVWDGSLNLWHVVTAHVLPGNAAPAYEWQTLVRFAAAIALCLALMKWRTRWLHAPALVVLLLSAHFGYGAWVLRYPPAERPAGAAGEFGSAAPIASPPPTPRR